MSATCRATATALLVALLTGPLVVSSARASEPEPSGGGLVARPPAAGTGVGVVAEVDGVVATVEGVVADFTLAGDVYFDSGSAVLLPRATADLAAVAGQVRQAGVTALLVVGHTDTVGSDESNQVLSDERAAAVVAALHPQLPGVTLTAEGRGETELVAAETTEDGEDDPAGRALNRRVTISPAE